MPRPNSTLPDLEPTLYYQPDAARRLGLSNRQFAALGLVPDYRHEGRVPYYSHLALIRVESDIEIGIDPRRPASAPRVTAPASRRRRQPARNRATSRPASALVLCNVDGPLGERPRRRILLRP